MAEQGMEAEKKHTLTARARAYMQITGVVEVDSFDDRTVQLQTDCGELTLEGEELHIGTLDIGRGIVEVTGRINGCYYQDGAPQKRGLRARFFG
jgi:sporulation protein YabP